MKKVFLKKILKSIKNKAKFSEIKVKNQKKKQKLENKTEK